MNTSVQDQLDRAYLGLVWFVVIAAAVYFLKVILALVLKRRAGPGLAPALSEDHPQTFFPRVLALVGVGAAPRETFGVVRLGASLGLKAVAWGGAGLIAWVHRGMDAPNLGLETLILGLVALNALQIQLYEIRYDRAEVSLPRWWFGHTTHRWRDLVAVTSRDPWLLTLHFANGQKVKVHKYIVGHAAFMALAMAEVRSI